MGGGDEDGGGGGAAEGQPVVSSELHSFTSPVRERQDRGDIITTLCCCVTFTHVFLGYFYLSHILHAFTIAFTIIYDIIPPIHSFLKIIFGNTFVFRLKSNSQTIHSVKHEMNI